jgi:hypothetical protein
MPGARWPLARGPARPPALPNLVESGRVWPALGRRLSARQGGPGERRSVRSHQPQNCTDSPQPHVPLALGLLNLKPWPIIDVTKSSSVPRR